MGHPHAVRIAYNPGRTGPVEPAGHQMTLKWRGPSHVFQFGVMRIPTMAFLMDMVVNEMNSIMEDRVVRQIFGAVARGQLALQEEETKYQPLRVDDMVFLQTDSNVQA